MSSEDLPSTSTSVSSSSDSFRKRWESIHEALIRMKQRVEMILEEEDEKEEGKNENYKEEEKKKTVLESLSKVVEEEINTVRLLITPNLRGMYPWNTLINLINAGLGLISKSFVEVNDVHVSNHVDSLHLDRKGHNQGQELTIHNYRDACQKALSGLQKYMPEEVISSAKIQNQNEINKHNMPLSSPKKAGLLPLPNYSSNPISKDSTQEQAPFISSSSSNQELNNDNQSVSDVVKETESKNKSKESSKKRKGFLRFNKLGSKREGKEGGEKEEPCKNVNNEEKLNKNQNTIPSSSSSLPYYKEETTDLLQSFHPVNYPSQPLSRILDPKTFPRRKYRTGLKHDVKIEHWGQRKLFFNELELLTKFSQDGDTIVYAGAAPGDHLILFRKLFPSLKWILVDPAPFQVENECGPTPDDQPFIEVINDLMTDERAQLYSNRNDIIFLSDIRRTYTDEDLIAEDMADQMRWIDIMKPKLSHLKFRLPWRPGKTRYLKGDIYFQPYVAPHSTETRLVVHQKDNFTKIEYDNKAYEDNCFFYNTVLRIQKCNHQVSDSGLDFHYSYDNAIEIEILRSYLLTRGFQNSNSNSANLNTTSNRSENTSCIDNTLTSELISEFDGENRKLPSSFIDLTTPEQNEEIAKLSIQITEFLGHRNGEKWLSRTGKKFQTQGAMQWWSRAQRDYGQKDLSVKEKRELGKKTRKFSSSSSSASSFPKKKKAKANTTTITTTTKGAKIATRSIQRNKLKPRKRTKAVSTPEVSLVEEKGEEREEEEEI